MVKTKVLEACHMKEAQKEVANRRFIAYLLATGKLSVVILPKSKEDSENKNLPTRIRVDQDWSGTSN